MFGIPLCSRLGCVLCSILCLQQVPCQCCHHGKPSLLRRRCFGTNNYKRGNENQSERSSEWPPLVPGGNTCQCRYPPNHWILLCRHSDVDQPGRIRSSRLQRNVKFNSLNSLLSLPPINYLLGATVRNQVQQKYNFQKFWGYVSLCICYTLLLSNGERVGFVKTRKW